MKNNFIFFWLIYDIFWFIFKTGLCVLVLFLIYFQTVIDGARKVRFERMTPIRKGREKTEVAMSPEDDRFKIAKKRSLGPQNFS